ncbi:c-type cytochrome [Phreatobacter sp. AB_2022a]|uniref:c-type cytochrome n=1 Tax=Phreatobacter sp. AB_2022a TaxID=3003134 RepID=UPI0022872702|nr:c-type cytochrome [Phreatobacter sp. AB_2022a]MCZ0733931.1 c-type cytochrome [Phreatobacter sp. AB_2022a]
MIRAALAFALTGRAVLVPAMAQEPGRGAALFEACSACHSQAPGAAGTAGPNLAGLGGRLVGSDPGFDYSPALKAARAAGLRWDKDRLETFLADPEAMFPGTWMSPPGLARAEDRAALAAFLVTASP